MVMELESRFSLSEVMVVISIVYQQFGLEPEHEDEFIEYMNILKQTFNHHRDISSVPHVYQTSQQF